MRKIILASASPRRKELLRSIGLKFRIVPSKVEEKPNPRLKPKAQVQFLSLQKAEAIVSKVANAIVIAADTMVVFGEELLGKPRNLEEAKRMLKKLQGKMHTVVTGFTIIDTESGRKVSKSVAVKVFVKKLSNKEIEKYVRRENVLDKAGAYAVQGIGAVIVDKIEGDYSTVVGLPLNLLAKELQKFGVTVL